MPNQGLLFIPDISGFTRFINQTEIEHSRLIIQELLEILINSNEIGLEISEIEGDAILFYKFGEPPALDQLYNQVSKMFCAFHRNLIAYDNRRYCQCTACISAADLTLKVITHYGEFTGYTVKSFNKLIGKDIIVAHQLLKNNIPQHEYWLITKNLLPDQSPAGLAEWMRWNISTKQTETGEIPFHYTLLSPLKSEIPAEPPTPPAITKKIRMISLTKEYDTDIITLFHATGDFNYRHRWKEGVIKVEELNHFLPRVGMRCRCILENGETITYSSSYSYSPDRIEFCETEENINVATYFTLEKIEEQKTRLKLDYYISNNLWSQLFFKMKKTKMEGMLARSMENITGLVKEIHLPR